jgi:hypothetical protein
VADICLSGLHQIGEIDLRRLDPHPNVTIESPVLSVSCRPNPPFVKLMGLARLSSFGDA